MPRRSARITSCQGITSRVRSRAADVGAPSPSRSSRPSRPTTSPVTFSVRGVSPPRTSCTRPSVIARLGANRKPDQLGEPHSCDPGIFSIHGEPVVAATEPQLLRRLAKPYARLDLGHLFPRNAHELTADDPRSQPAEDASPPPGRRAGEDRDDSRFSRRDTLELEIVDIPAAPAFAVHQLVVENAQAEIDLGSLCSTPGPCSRAGAAESPRRRSRALRRGRRRRRCSPGGRSRSSACRHGRLRRAGSGCT